MNTTKELRLSKDETTFKNEEVSEIAPMNPAAFGRFFLKPILAGLRTFGILFHLSFVQK